MVKNAVKGIKRFVTIPLSERFWEKVDKSGECWDWQGTLCRGYGTIWVNGRLEKAHRVSWEFINGKIPEKKLVLHRCDNEKCVNPAHLFMGDHLDNMRDAANKKRMHHSNRKPTIEEIHLIRNLRSSFTQDELAKRFGFHSSTIRKIQLRQTWETV